MVRVRQHRRTTCIATCHRLRLVLKLRRPPVPSRKPLALSRRHVLRQRDRLHNSNAWKLRAPLRSSTSKHRGQLHNNTLRRHARLRQHAPRRLLVRLPQRVRRAGKNTTNNLTAPNTTARSALQQNGPFSFPHKRKPLSPPSRIQTGEADMFHTFTPRWAQSSNSSSA